MLTAVIALTLDCLMSGELSPLEHHLSYIRWGSVAKFVAVVFASNVLYGSAVQTALQESVSKVRTETR